MGLIDEPTETRDEEKLDGAGLESFLKKTFPELTGSLAIRQYPGGASNLTYLLTMDGKEYILRRPPFGKIAKSAHNMGREYRILKALRPFYPYCPEPLVYSDDSDIIGSEFFIMERIRGIILRRDLPPGLSYTREESVKLCHKLLDVLIELHAIDIRKAGLDTIGKPAGYAKRQVDGWINRYRAARTDNVPDFEDIMKWMVEKMPPDTDHPTMIHNDYRFDNVVMDERDPMNIIGVLDWEMATVGDPLMDLGNSLAYWVEADATPEAVERTPVPFELTATVTRNELRQRYGEKTGRNMDSFDYYFAFGLFRLVGIVQQIYYRFYHGQTTNEKFADYNERVESLEESIQKLIDNSDL
ncbi:MAG: phosphotransferase family protein [Proteobacteria bacterium]|nr:phosphotransferase family protein [Pseudomonadota bacterium]